jgi:cystathionine gamma-synthase
VLASNFHGGDYAREQGSSAWGPLEQAIGELEGGTTVAFASGVAAAAAVIDTLPVGAHVVGPADGYAWTRRLLHDRHASGRIHLREVDTTDTDATVRAAADADLLWLETPSNPLLEITELDVIGAELRDRDVRVAVDATFATPLLQQPLDLGADLSVHSATKFIGGHSDLLLGLVTARDPADADRLVHARAQQGATPGSMEAYLALRGLRTLPARLRIGQGTAQVLAQRLDAHPGVTTVRYPGLPTDAGHQRARRFMSGFGAMLSVELDATAAQAEDVCRHVEVFTHAKSLGGVESLIDRRARYAENTGATPAALLRLSIGCEDVEDLWDDLSAALDVALGTRRDAAG